MEWTSMNRIFLCMAFCLVVKFFTGSSVIWAGAPIAPSLSVSTNETTVTLSWTSTPDTDGYTLLYAPYPDASYIGNVDMGNLTSFSAYLQDGASFYVAIQPYNDEGDGSYSNICIFFIDQPIAGYSGQILPFTQQFVGDRDNLQDSGAWWGENISKIVNKANKTFTVIVDNNADPRTAFLYEKTDDGEWEEGQSFIASRIPNILIDSDDIIHIVGFEAFDPRTDVFSGRIYHVKFHDPLTVKGSYTKEYITQDWRSNLTLDAYASIYVGAAIHADDTMLVAYNNSIQWNAPHTHSIGVRIYNPSQNSWIYESVATNMPSRHCYPFAFITDDFYHVFTIEDDYDLYFENIGPPYDSYPFRYGMIKHFQRSREGGNWNETTLVDFNLSKTKEEIWKMGLRIEDFYVDSKNIIHAIFRYKSKNYYKTLHHWKSETEPLVWNNEEILPGKYFFWVKLWERPDGKIFYICHNHSSKQFLLIDKDTNQQYIISDLRNNYIWGATPFAANKRGGSDISNTIFLVIYSGNYNIQAVSIDVDTSNL